MPELSFLRKCRLTSVHWKEGEAALTCQFLQQMPSSFNLSAVSALSRSTPRCRQNQHSSVTSLAALRIATHARQLDWRWEESLMVSLPLLTNWKDFWPRSIKNEQTKKCFHKVKRCGQTTSSLSNIERSLRTKWTNGSHFLMVEQTQVGSKWRNARQNTGDVSMSN